MWDRIRGGYLYTVRMGYILQCVFVNEVDIYSFLAGLTLEMNLDMDS